MCDLFPIGKNELLPDYYIMIEYIETPSMLGYGSDGVAINAYRIDTGKPSIREIGLDELKEAYRLLIGRKNRIDFWHIIKNQESEPDMRCD